MDVHLPSTLESFLSKILLVVFSLGLIASVTPWFLLALVPLAVLFAVVYRVFTRVIRDIRKADMVARSPLISHLTASTQGIASIYAYAKGKSS